MSRMFGHATSIYSHDESVQQKTSVFGWNICVCDGEGED